MAGKQFKLSILINAVDKFTAPIDRMTKRLDAIAAPATRVGNAFASLWHAAGVDRLTSGFQNLTSAIGGVGSAAMTAAKRIAGIGAAVGGAVFAFKKGVIDPVEDLQRVGISLQALEGGPEQAKASMGFIKRLDAKSPFNVQQIADSFLLMRGQGMDPTHQTRGLQAIVDQVALRGGNSESLERAVLSISQMFGNQKVDATNMRELAFNKIPSWEILRIALEKRNHRSLTIAEVKKASENGELGEGSLNAFMDELGGGKAKGAAELLNSKTIGGLLSSLSGQFLYFKQKVLGVDDAGDAVKGGLFEKLQMQLQQLLEKLASPEWQQRLDQLAKVIGDRLGKAFDWLLANGPQLWDDFTSGLETVWNLANRVAQTFGGWTKLGLFALGAYIGGPMLGAVGNLILAFGSLAAAIGLTPAGWLLGVLAALGLMAYVLVDDWGAFGTFFVDLWTNISDILGGALEMVRGLCSAVKDLATLDFKGAFSQFERAARGANRHVGGLAGAGMTLASSHGSTARAIGRFLTKPEADASLDADVDSALGVPGTASQPSLVDLFSRPMNLGATLAAAGGPQAIGVTKPSAAPTGGFVERFEAAVQRFEEAYLKVQVDFKNVPPGTSTKTEQRGIELSRGASMAHAY